MGADVCCTTVERVRCADQVIDTPGVIFTIGENWCFADSVGEAKSAPIRADTDKPRFARRVGPAWSTDRRRNENADSVARILFRAFCCCGTGASRRNLAASGGITVECVLATGFANLDLRIEAITDQAWVTFGVAQTSASSGNPQVLSEPQAYPVVQSSIWVHAPPISTRQVESTGSQTSAPRAVGNVLALSANDFEAESVFAYRGADWRSLRRSRRDRRWELEPHRCPHCRSPCGTRHRQSRARRCSLGRRSCRRSHRPPPDRNRPRRCRSFLVHSRDSDGSGSSGSRGHRHKRRR